MKTFITLYTLSVPVFIACDLLWLGIIAKDFYQSKLGYLLGDVNWGAAILFYFLFIGGLTLFATMPSLEGGMIKTIVFGGLFGLVTYATYDLTNHATIRDWPLVVTVVDIAWGTVLGALVAVAARLGYAFLS